LRILLAVFLPEGLDFGRQVTKAELDLYRGKILCF